ncbi:MAG: redoxin domain-containing protein [Acidobacteria bacterium]|nr:redoxin domain-containing protein [Acidobacteriota bacterium]NIM63292.1 redoxin domain-containing protein [Acidobacteriota bacterium]NIO59139.1 redoxin domain-containing protein [Acidobacteriota bacterium]NIQ30171.1 redoxin domain-containing protein [Acidobacteriota bacterium]NIQ85039.1 redoxin domain-containing protein [Acidobacteriota bacterium]
MKRTVQTLLLASLFVLPTVADELASDFTFEDINPASTTFGEKITLSEEYAEGGVLVNFLASWCNPCWQELPILQEMVDAGKVKVIGMAADEYGAGPEGVLTMVARKELTLPILWVDVEAAKELEKRYTYQTLPSTYIIRSDGTIAGLLAGAVSPERLHAEVARAFDSASEETR